MSTAFIDAASADASFFVTLTNDVGVTLDDSPSAVTQDAPGNGWDYSASAPALGTTWNKVARPTVTTAGSGPYTDENPFVINTLNNFQLYDANGTLTDVRLKGFVIGSPTGADPRLLNVTPLSTVAPQLLNDTWGTNSTDTAAYLKFTFTGLAPNTDYVLYAYSNATDPNQGAKWILHPDNFPAITSSTYFYPTLPDRETTFLDLAGHIGTITIFGADSASNTVPVPGAAANIPAALGDNTPWGAMHVKTTASGELTFRGGNSGFASNRRWMTGFQLIPYPAPVITEHPLPTSTAVLNVSTDLTAVARDLVNLRFADEADQNPLTYTWQFSSDNGATWTDITDSADPAEDPLLPETTPAGAYDIFLDRDPPLPAAPDDPDAPIPPAPPVKRLISTLVIHAPQYTDAGLYRLKVTNVAGVSALSDPCVLTVIDHADPFSITQQPRPDAATVGDAAAFSVSVDGTPPFTYIWQKQACDDPSAATPDGATATGAFTDVLTVTKTRATTSALEIPFLRRADTGYYRVKVMDVMQKETDPEHCLISDTVYLYVEYAPPVITPPGRQTVTPGGSLNLYGDIYTEIPLLWHKWQVSHDNGATWTDLADNATYSGATTDTLTITAATAAEAGQYRIVSANDLGTTEGGAISLAVAAPMIAHPVAVAADRAGRVYAADDTTNLIYQFTPAAASAPAAAAAAPTLTAVRFAGQSGVAGSADGYYGQATFNAPAGAAIGPANVVYLADTGNHTLRALRATGEVTTLAGSPSATGNADGAASAASFTAPAGITHDAAGNLYVADRMAHVIRRVTPTTFDVTTLAGVPADPGSAGGITADTSGNTLARFNSPGAIAASPVTFAATGTAIPTEATTTTTLLYVADTANNAIRKITLTWWLDRDPITNIQTRVRIRQNDVSTLAGLTGVAGHADGDGSAAQFNAPSSLAVDDAGAIYVADTGNNTIRKITLSGANGSTVTVSTLAGLPGIAGHQDGPGAATSLDGLTHNLFNRPLDVSVDPDGNVYVADTGNAAVRKITPAGLVSTLVPDPGPDPVPPSDTGAGGSGGNNNTGNTGDRPDIPPAGSGDGSGEFGGGAPTPWFLAALAFLVLLRKFRARLRPARSMGVPPMKVEAASSRLDGEAAGSSSTGILPVSLRSMGVPPMPPVSPIPSIPTVSSAASNPPAPPHKSAPPRKPAPLPLMKTAALSTLTRATARAVLAAAFTVAAAFAPAPSARAADNPAVFLKLTRQDAGSGATPTAATTKTIAAPGSGWDYSAAAPYPGTTWNVIRRPHDDDTKPFFAGTGIFTLTTANNLTLFKPDGSASGVSVTASLEITTSASARGEPGYGSVTADATLGPVALMNDNGNWRVYYGTNNTIWEFAGLPANAHYLAYCYGATHSTGQGAKFILPAAYNPVTTDSVWLDTHGGDGSNAHVFANNAGVISPRDPAPLGVDSAAGSNINTVWGILHAQVDVAGKLVLTTAKNKQNGQYLTGFQLIPYPLATITTDLPSTTTASFGGNVTLTIVASGFDADDTSNLTYQWRKDGAEIAATNATATTPALTLTALAATDEGNYDCVVTNYGGDTITTATALTVSSSAVAPSISAAPASETAITGATVTFAVTANGTDPLTFTWQKSTTGAGTGADIDIDTGFTPLANGAVTNAATITGADTRILTLTGLTTADAGWYRVKISNDAGSIISTAVTLTVAPVITAPPTGAVVTPGSATSLTVTADTGGIAAAPFAPTYVWKRNDVPVTNGTAAGITGADTATLAFAAFAAANSGVYTVTVSNDAGSVTSDPVYLGTPATMTATLWPAAGATGVNPDSPLKLAFTGGTPARGSIGKILIRDAVDDSIAETIDLSALVTLHSDDNNHTFPDYASKSLQGLSAYYQPVAIYGNEVWITHATATTLQYNKTYYVTIEPGVLFDQDGATYPGIAAADKTTWSFTTRAVAPDISGRAITVAADGAGDYTTLQAALDQVPQSNTAATPYTITLAPGIYRERAALRENRHYVTIRGSGATRTDTVLSHGWTGSPTGDRCSVLILSTTDTRVENMTIENIAGQVGPQMALYGDKERHVFDNLLITGWQDTLGTWNNHIAYFRDCEIWGSVDFIYSGGTALFDHCDIVQIRDTGGPLAAPSTDYANPLGIIFLDCRILKGRLSTGHPMDVAAASSTLMRPWYPNGHTAYINCQLDDHITVKGWSEWDNRENTARAIEYGSTLIAGAPAPTPAERQSAGAYWLNTIDPDYDGVKAANSADLAPPSGHLNRTAVTVNPADYTVEAVFGHTFYAAKIGSWRPTVAPRILAQPQPRAAAPGATITLAAEVFGLPAGTYQWYKDAAPVTNSGVISGADTATLTLTGAQPADTGAYHLVVTNALGSAATAAATVTISASLTAPAITTHPNSQTVDAGDPVTFTVAASGDPAPTYEWYKDGSVTPLADGNGITGAATATLSIASARASDAGAYYAIARNTEGFATSNTATLTVNGGGAPGITTQPVSQITPAGSSVTLTVAATDAIGYQWYKNGVALTDAPGLSGATTATLTIATPASADAGSYYCVITGAGGDTTSATVTLTVEGAVPNPAVFVKIATSQATNGAAPTTAGTFTLAAPGSGWDYGAAAPYAGETWNTIQRPGGNDLIKSGATDSLGTFTLNTANNIALAAADGSTPGVTLTAAIVVGELNGTRTEPNTGAGGTSALGPNALMGQAWRIYLGGNTTNWEFAGLPAGARYLVYCYGATTTQGCRFILDNSNLVGTDTAMWLETHGVDGNGNVFAQTGDAIAPVPPAPSLTVANAADNKNTTWGFMHAKVDASGKLSVATAKNANNNQYFNGFQLIPYPKALITTHPDATAYVATGDTTTLTIAATGYDDDDTLTYQWRKDGVPINTAANPTADTAVLTITNAQTADAGSYDCVVTNAGGSIISDPCTLNLTIGTGAPAIVLQPLPQFADAGATASFTVAAGGQPPLTYTWQKSVTSSSAGFADIPGAPSASTLSLAALAPADAGWYRVVITNTYDNPAPTAGSITSDAVTLTIAPVITAPPASDVIAANAPAALTVTADTGGIAAAPFAPAYEWFKDASTTPLADGGNITGATTATLQFAAFSAADAGSYTVVVTNAAGHATSAPAVLQLPVVPFITTHPAALQNALVGQTVSFTVVASGIPAPTYEWFKDGSLTPLADGDGITGATTATLTIASVTDADAGSYTVTATNMAGPATSTPAVLTVRDLTGPAITGDGFAEGVTGGAGGQPYEVTTAADLQSRLQLPGPAIIIVSGTIDLNTLSNRRVNFTSNKTVQGAGADTLIIGALNVADVDNVIVRGLTVTNPGSVIDNDPSSSTYGKYKDSGDGVSVWNSTNVLVTHCTFYDCGDGCVDITRPGVDNVTVSWCKFYYGADAAVHRFTMILGNIEPDNADYLHPVRATLHHNWWGTNCHERMPASTSARGHLYNNYFSCSGNYYSSNARNNSHLLIEHSFYTGVANPVIISANTTGLIHTINNTYNNTTFNSGVDARQRKDTLFTPPYSYTLAATADVPALIQTHAGNTAGAWSAHPAPSAPLAITGLPATFFPGDTLTLAPSAAAPAGATHQWRRNNADIPGATTATLELANIQTPQLGDYTVAVTDTAGNTTVSTPVTLAFGDAPSFTGETGGPSPIVTGKTITLRPAITGAVTAYQWQRWDASANAGAGAWVNVTDGGAISGATTAALTLQNATADLNGDYRLVITNPTGSNPTAPYAVTVTPVVFAWPAGVAVDAFGDVYVSDASASVIRRVTATGSAALHAGAPGVAGSADGDFGQSTFNAPGALAIDATGNLYVADTGNATIRRVGRDHAVLTLAGDPAARGNRDGIGNAALFATPNGLSLDRTTGVTYLADTNNHTIRALTPRALNNGIFTGNTVATLAGAPGHPGDSDAAILLITTTNAAGVITGTNYVLDGAPLFNHPGAVAVTGDYLYIADTGNNAIRRLTIAGNYKGEVLTLAGLPGVTGSDDGTGLAALFSSPKAIVSDPAGATLYIADTGNHTIRRVALAGALPAEVTTLAGLPGISGQADGPGPDALFNQPAALALDVTGSHLYVADIGNTAIRRLTITGTAATVATLTVLAADDTPLPPAAPLPPFTPTSSGDGGGAPTPLLLAALAALLLARHLRNRR